MLYQITHMVDIAGERNIPEAVDHSNMDKHLVAVEGIHWDT